jgi:iron complex outermembrane receptor protein
LLNCLGNAASPACNLISRDVATGGFTNADGYVSGVNENVSAIHKRGYDFQADYHFRLRDTGFLPDWGSVSMDFVGTYEEFSKTGVPDPTQKNPNAIEVRQCAGEFGPICGIPEPRWRHKVRVTWATPWKVDLSLQWRYIQAEQLDADSSNPALNNGNRYSIIDGSIPAYSYIDLSGSWRVRDNITLRAGVNNVFDKDPPILDTNIYPITSAAGNTYPNMYDPLGRTIFVNLTGKF